MTFHKGNRQAFKPDDEVVPVVVKGSVWGTLHVYEDGRFSMNATAVQSITDKPRWSLLVVLETE